MNIKQKISTFWNVCAGTSRHFSSLIHNGFFNDVWIIFMDKTDSSDPLHRENYWRRTLNTMAPFGLIIEDSFWSIIMVINESVIINIYLTCRSCYCFGLFLPLRFSDNGYIYWLFLLLWHRVEWRLFRLIYGECGFCWLTVFTDFRVKNPRGCTKSWFAEAMSLITDACKLIITSSNKKNRISCSITQYSCNIVWVVNNLLKRTKKNVFPAFLLIAAPEKESYWF